MRVDQYCILKKRLECFDIGFVDAYLVRCSRTLADLGRRVTARRALMLLDVKRAATY